MADSKPAKAAAKAVEPASAKGRQDGDYEPPVLTEPKGGPVPGAKSSKAAKPKAG